MKIELIRRDQKEKVIAYATVTLHELRSTKNLEKTMTGETSNIKLIIQEFVYSEKASFLDYVFGSCEISLIIGIDFSKSNGLQNSIKSLHHLSEQRPNEYLQAIKAVGEILQYYDTDKKIPAFGFGAKLPPYMNVVSHCFAMNGNIFSPEVEGIEGVIEAYKAVLSQIEFHGPTVFNELISEVIEYAKAEQVTQYNQKYYILLLITDGGVTDMQSTTAEIVKASELPISIVLVGVGNENFDNMKLLDADDSPLVHQRAGRQMKRDIVQFVEYAKYKNNPELLVREVLFEIPTQLIDFMEANNIKPNFPDQGCKDYAGKISLAEFLEKKKQSFINKIISLGFDTQDVVEALQNGIACNSVDLAIELIKFLKHTRKLKKIKKL